MNRTSLALVAGLALMAITAGAVEPSYHGPLGNPEEPALRPYKWFWHGLKSFAYQTKEGFVRGNMNTPILGSVKTLRGVRRGTYNLVESTYHGAVFAPLPPRNTRAYRDPGTVNQVAEEDWLLRHSSDFLFTWYLFPVLKYVDHYPLEDDAKVDVRLERAAEIRAERRAGWRAREDAERLRLLEEIDDAELRDEYAKEYVEALAKQEPQLNETTSEVHLRAARQAAREMELHKDRMVRAQTRYIGERAPHSRKRVERGEGNLLRLAK